MDCTPTAIRWRASCCSKSRSAETRRTRWRDELLKVHRSYLKPIRALMDAGVLKGAAHITGGGITDNIPRMLPKGLGGEIDPQSWGCRRFSSELREIGNIPLDDYRRTFNLGIGMIW